MRRDVKMVSARGVSAPQHDFVRQVQLQFQVPPSIVCDRFACGSVMEAEFISVLDGYATHGMGREGDLEIAEFVLAVSLSSDRWDYTDLNEAAPGGRAPHTDMRVEDRVRASSTASSGCALGADES